MRYLAARSGDGCERGYIGAGMDKTVRIFSMRKSAYRTNVHLGLTGISIIDLDRTLGCRDWPGAEWRPVGLRAPASSCVANKPDGVTSIPLLRSAVSLLPASAVSAGNLYTPRLPRSQSADRRAWSTGELTQDYRHVVSRGTVRVARAGSGCGSAGAQGLV
jgi:hypothetical protein